MTMEHSETSYEQTASKLIYTGKCHLTSLKVITDGSNDAVVIIYDSLTASGQVLDETTVVASDNYGGIKWAFPVSCKKGLYASVSGTGASYIVEYIKP